jgi:hypothetical protein
MKPAIMMALLILQATLALAASTPQQLVQALGQAVHQGDVDSFMANTSDSSRKALQDEEAAFTRLTVARENFQAALDERFGKSTVARPPAHPGPRPALLRCQTIDLLRVQKQEPNRALLRLRVTKSSDSGKELAEYRTVTVVLEAGGWKLDLTDMAREQTGLAGSQSSAYEQVAQQIRSGTFKNRIAASIALANSKMKSRIGGGK